MNELGWYHSIELPGGKTIVGLQSVEQLRKRIEQFPIPRDLRGKRVLDVGAWVVALDSTERHRLKEAKALLGSSVECVTADICRVKPGELGCFDYVLFFGVLYHLKHPLLALENICALATEAAFVESYVCDPTVSREQAPSLEFYEGEELGGQFDNWFGPNVACLQAMCRTAGFARVEFESILLNRAHVSCYRKWRDLPPNPASDLVIVSSKNASGETPDFIGEGADEYVSVWFKSDESGLTPDCIFPEFGPFGSRAVHLSATGPGGYLVNCKLPPGLPPGNHRVSLATQHGRSVNFGVVRVGDVPSVVDRNDRASGPPVIRTAADGLTWSRDEISLGPQGGFLSLWVENIPAGTRESQIQLRSGDAVYQATFVSLGLPDGLTQVNFLIPPSIPPGLTSFRLIAAGMEGEPFRIRISKP